MISDYTTLIAAVKRWGHRFDTDDVIPDFIALAEADISRRLRTTQQETTWAAQTVVSGRVALPADWVAFRQLWADDLEYDLTAKPINVVTALQATAERPEFYCVQGGDVVVSRNDGTIQGIYFARVPALSNAAPTNWLLTAEPGVYLKAALRHAWAFAGNAQKASQYEAEANAIMAEIQLASDRDKFSGQQAFTPGGP